MNIAVFIKSTTYHEGYGGLETQNKVLCEGLVGRGHKVTVFSPQRELKDINKSENGVQYVFIPSVYRLGFGASPNNWTNKSREEFVKRDEQDKFDLVVSQSSAGIGVIKDKHKLGIRVVSVCHGSILGEFRTRLSSLGSIGSIVRLFPDLLFTLRVFFGRQRAFVHGADKVVAVSNAVKRAIVEETFVDEGKVCVIHNGVDPQKFQHRVGKYGKPHVVYLGRIIESKGPILLLDMIKGLNCILDYFGDGEDKALLEEKVKEKELVDNVVIHGWIPPDQVPGRLLASDIFAFPTLRVEGLPMVLVEALFAGLPIVAFNMGGVSDVIEDGVNGFLLGRGDIKGFERSLSELVSKPELRQKMSLASTDIANANFSLQVMIQKYEHIFSEVQK